MSTPPTCEWLSKRGQILVPHLGSCPNTSRGPEGFSDFGWSRWWQKTTNQLIMSVILPKKTEQHANFHFTIFASNWLTPEKSRGRHYTDVVCENQSAWWTGSSLFFHSGLTTRCDGQRTCRISKANNHPPILSVNIATSLGLWQFDPGFSRCRAATARPVRVPCTAAASPAMRTV